MPPSISGLEYKSFGTTTVLEHKTAAPAAVEAHRTDGVGIVDAYVAVTGVRDDVGDIIEPGAFVDTLKKIRPKMCLGHDWNRPIGEPVEIEELLPGDPRLPKADHDGNPWPAGAGALWTRSRYMLGTRDGRNAYEHAKFYGPRTAYSIGYVPDKTKVRFTSEKGLRTRRLPKLDLYEYGPVLHGANALARQASIKSAQPADFEGKVRLVRNMEYWGLPVGTPIRPGMKPRGPIARRLERAGKPVDPDKGVVEVDAGDAPKPAGPRSGAAQEGALFTAPKSNVRIKPTARGVNKRNDGTFESDIITLFTENPNIDPDSGDFETFDETRGVPDRQKINKGENYNPLDMLIANAVTPAELEEDLRNNSEWTTATRAGEVADANAAPEVDRFIDDVMDVYREKYNAALVAQHGKDLPDDVADLDTEDEQGIDQGDQAPTNAPSSAPRRSTTSLTAMAPKDLAKVISEMDDDELAAHDEELSARAQSLGKPGQRNRAHQAIVDERARRAASVPANEEAAPEESADGGQPTGGQPGTWRPQGVPGEPVAPRDEDPELTTVQAEDRPQGYDLPPDPEKGTPEGTENTPDNEIEDVSAGEQPSAVDGEMGTPADIPEDVPGAEPAGVEAPEAVVEAPEVAVEEQQETGEFEPGTVLDDTGRPVPRAPINDAGDFYDDRGDIVSGMTEFDQVLNEATDAINDGDEARLADALAPFAGVAEPTDPASTRFDPSAEAVALIEQPPVRAIAQVQEWTEQANQRQGADVEADRTATASALETADDDYLATEAARMRGILIARSAAGDPPTDGFVREAAMRLRLIQAEQAKREQGGDPEQDVTEPITPEDAAVIAAEELADAQDIADASHGIHEAEDGEFEADGDIADRQDRVAGLLTQADAGALDFSDYDDDGLRSTRADVLGELRLQSYLDARRSRKIPATRQQQEQEDTNGSAGEVTSPPGAVTEDADLAEPPGPRPRPGVAGAAEDLADALEDGNEDRIAAAQARLRSSLNRSRSTSEHVLALRTLMESGNDLDPVQLRALAEAIRVETRAKRNASARDRRRVRRFERERLRSLLSDVETAMSARGLSYDATPEDSETEDRLTNYGGTPGAGTWTERTEKIEWAGITNTVREVSGTHYSASVVSKADGKSTYHWEIRYPDREEVLTGSGDTAAPETAVSMVELILGTQRARGVLAPDTVLPHMAPRTASSALPSDVVAARSDAIMSRLASGIDNPLTGLPDPLRTRPTLIPPPVKAFDQPLDVREYLLAQVARETDDDKRERLASAIAQIRWDDVTLSPGGGLAVFSTAGQRGYHIMHTRSGARVDILINGTSSANLSKADQVRIMAIMESVPNDRGQVVDFNQDQSAVREAFHDFGSIAGSDSYPNTVASVFIGEKLRSGNLPAGLLKVTTIGESNIGWANRTNPSRYDAVRGKTVALGYLLGKGKADKETRKTVQHGWALASAGAPDVTVALYRRRAEELRQEFGAKAGDRGAILLDEIADNMQAMWAPEQAQGERARSLKTGERLTITEDDGVRNYRLLTDMRVTSDHARQSEAQVIDENTGAVYRLGIWNDFNRTDSLTLWPVQKGGNHIWSLPLSGNEFAVTDGEEAAPEDAEAVRARARADIDSVPQDVLDAAANLLAENTTEAEERRATGARSRTDARAPRRRAATPPDEPQPIPGEQHLAGVQGRILPGWVGEGYSESETSAAGGFTSEEEWREFIAAERARLSDDYQASRGLAVIDNLNYEKVTLSPGGHFVITSDNYVVHARSLHAVWGMGNTHWDLTNGAKLTAASSLAVAAHLERAQLNGQSVDWTKGADKIGDEVQGFVKANGNIVAPAAKSAYQRMLATGKTLRISDIEAFEKMTQEAGQGSVPNPAALYSVQNFHVTGVAAHPYAQAGNARTVGRDRVAVATTKAGQTLAKKVEFEIRLAAAMSKVAPLDAVRRLTTIADAIDGQTIETIDHANNEARGTLDPAKDLRAIAKAITDGYDEKQLSPMGRLLRNNFTGTIRVNEKVRFQTNVATQQHVTDARYGDTELTEIQVWTDEDGVRHATFADHHIVHPPVGYTGELAVGKTRTNTAPGQISTGIIRLTNDETGELSLSWHDIGGIYTNVRIGKWEFEPPAEPDVPDTPEGDAALPEPEVSGSAPEEDRTSSDAALSEDEGASPLPMSGAQADLNQALARTNREREPLRGLTAAELRERLDDARRRAATDASVQEEIRILRRELDAREDAGRDVAKAPGTRVSAGVDEEIENKVREAYESLVREPGDWAGIVDVRNRLGEQFDRAEVDRVLKDMNRRGVVVIAPESNRKALTEEDHAAALRLGGEDNHLIMFQRRAA